MLTKKKLESLQYCRSCLNHTYGRRLRQQDVIIYYMPRQCEKCGEVKHIVRRVKFPFHLFGRL